MAQSSSTKLLHPVAALVVGFAVHFLSAGALAGQAVHGRVVDVVTGVGIDRAFRDSLPRAAQQSPVSVLGTILNSESLQPVEGVAVLIDSVALPQTSDSAGMFRTNGLEDGTHVLEFIKDGYIPRTFRVAITEHHEGEIDVGTLLLSHYQTHTVSIFGSVTDSMIGLPLSSADVLLNGENVAVTDLSGVFRLPSVQLRRGSNVFGVRRLGYQPMNADLWIANEDAELNIEVKLMPVAVQLSEVVVEGQRTVYHFGKVREFVRRSKTGLGHYITRQDFEQEKPSLITDLVDRVPGVVVGPLAAGSRIRLLRGGGCEPSIFLDGVLLNPASRRLDVNINDLVGPNEIEGIEIYKGAATIPFEFMMGSRGCGVVAIWTRR